ncbi:MAG: bifunctional phosphoribosylaminoimidazolecarboxamide formyltransferase/IMP cyclohydrolase [Bacteroidales bacterium]
MTSTKKIKNALISVFHKDGLDEIVKGLHSCGVELISTGGTEAFINSLGIPVCSVESLSSYPSILGGRVKTLHPKIFGGILERRDSEADNAQMQEYGIPEIDLVVVDLYPFEETIAITDEQNAIVEKIDIGGISLIRAAAKNFKDVVIIPSKNEYNELQDIIYNNCESSLEHRLELARKAFAVSSHYDSAIFQYFASLTENPVFTHRVQGVKKLRYGENPHQKGVFYGDLDKVFEHLHGKEISYNNLLDIEAAIQLVGEFEETTVAILKHNNACGCASDSKLLDAWTKALAGDPVSAFGGIIITNKIIDSETAKEMNKLFCEVVIAPEYEKSALDTLKSKKNRIILKLNNFEPKETQFRSLLNGVLKQDRDNKQETPDELNLVTKRTLSQQQTEDLLFANKLVKQSKSNAIVLAKGKQLFASGVGETSRVDALKHAIEKAKAFNFNLEGASMASDAFFPFADCVEIAHKEGINTIIQPGGSIRDNESIEYCDKNGMSMVFTGIRHFKH